jgi:hypothetical protein
MFSLFKSKKNEIVVPQWASFFNKAEYKTFTDAIDKFFYEKNISYTLGDGLINVGPNDFNFSVLGLTNIAQACKQSEPGEYQELVFGHFDAMIRTNQFEKSFEKIKDDYNSTEQYIGTRLYQLQYLEHGGKENKVYRMIAGDIAEVLVFDLPDAVHTLTPEQVGKWKKTWDELFNKGIENVRAKYSFDIIKERIGETDILLVQGDHFFVPNIIFDLEEKGLVGTWGALIGVPHRHAAIIYPLETLAVANAMTTIVPAIYGMNAEGPGSISNNLIWYKDGVFEELQYKMQDNNIELYPSEKFLEVLNSMTE